MKTIIKEEIDRIILLSKYDTKLTLNENQLISEQGAFQKLLQGAAKGVIEALAIDLKSLFKGGEPEAKAFFEKVKAGKASSTEISKISKEILKNPTLNSGGLFDTAVEAYATRLAKSTETLPKQFQNASRADRLAMLKNDGYPKETAERIVQAYEKTADKAIAISTAGNPALQKSLESGLGKQTVETLAKEPEVGKAFLENVRSFGWKNALKKTAGIGGLSILALWLYAKGEGATANDLPTEQPADAPVPSQQTSELPANIGGVEGVKNFQTYLDQKYPQGWAVRADGTKYITGGKPNMGFGRFGKNTARMWAGPDGEAFRKQTNTTPEKTKQDVYAGWRHGQSRVDNNITYVMDKFSPNKPEGQWLPMDDFKRRYPTTEITT